MKKLYLTLISILCSLSLSAQNVNVYKADMVLAPNNQEKIITSPLNSDALSWNSSSKKVATVDESGVVTALKEGKTTITVRIKGGNTVRIPVEVKNDAVAVNDLKFETPSLTVQWPQRTMLSATIEPQNATDKRIIWISSDPKIAIADSKGKIIPQRDGKVTVTAIAGNKSNTIEVTVAANEPQFYFVVKEKSGDVKLYDTNPSADYNYGKINSVYATSKWNDKVYLLTDDQKHRNLAIRVDTAQYVLSFDIPSNVTFNNFLFEAFDKGVIFQDQFYYAAQMLLNDKLCKRVSASGTSIDGTSIYEIGSKRINDSVIKATFLKSDIDKREFEQISFIDMPGNLTSISKAIIKKYENDIYLFVQYYVDRAKVCEVYKSEDEGKTIKRIRRFNHSDKTLIGADAQSNIYEMDAYGHQFFINGIQIASISSKDRLINTVVHNGNLYCLVERRAETPSHSTRDYAILVEEIVLLKNGVQQELPSCMKNAKDVDYVMRLGIY